MNIKLGTTLILLFLVTTSVASSSIVKYIDKNADEQLLNNLFFDFCYCNYSACLEDFSNYLGKIQIANDESDINSTFFENGNECRTNLGGLIDSPWPMKGHDLHHTCRSPYSTTDNNGEELWRFKTDNWIESGPCISTDGTIYFGSFDRYLYALNPDGSLKWKYKTNGWIWSTPAIVEDGTIYIGTFGDYLYAVNPNGTLKWNFWAGSYASITSSPAIAPDGTIYFGAMGPNLEEELGRIYAVNPDGSEKWHYDTDYWIVSDPAVGDDGTIYIGSGDNYLYALKPDGTLRWRFKTGGDVKSHPAIADDGTIYFDSFDAYLYALNPNGTMKWRVGAGGSSSASVAIGEDGTIYDPGKYHLNAWYPNGTLKWQFNLGQDNPIIHASPAVGAEGTIYVGTDGGEIIAINPDGTEKWRNKIASRVESSPCIGKDGTIFIGSSYGDYGYLFAFGCGEINACSDGPYYGLINQAVEFNGDVTGGHQPYTWYWNFGDESTSDEQNPIHFYEELGNYTVSLTVTDNEGNSSTDITWAWIQETNNPPNKPTIIGSERGKADNYYEYTFSAIDPEGNIVYYIVEWGDGMSSGWKGPYKSGEQMNLSHSWDEEGSYDIRAKARDVYGSESDWSALSVSMPKSKPYNPFWQLLERLTKRFPFLEFLFTNF